MDSLDDAIALLNSRGLCASRRQWSLGDSVVVTHAHGTIHSGIEVFPEALYIVCSGGKWEVVHFKTNGPALTVDCASLNEACDVVSKELLQSPLE